MTTAITLILVSILVFTIFVKIVYIDVIGHWPSWREIWDFHKVDEDAEGE